MQVKPKTEEQGHCVLVADNGPLRTPGGAVIRVATRELARQTAEEIAPLRRLDVHEYGLYSFLCTETDFVHADPDRTRETLALTVAEQLYWCFNANPPEFGTHGPCDPLWDRFFGEPRAWRGKLCDFGAESQAVYVDQHLDHFRPLVADLPPAVMTAMLNCGTGGLPVASAATLARPGVTWRDLSKDFQSWIWLVNGLQRQAAPKIKKELRLLAVAMDRYVRGGGAARS